MFKKEEGCKDGQKLERRVSQMSKMQDLLHTKQALFCKRIIASWCAERTHRYDNIFKALHCNLICTVTQGRAQFALAHCSIQLKTDFRYYYADHCISWNLVRLVLPSGASPSRLRLAVWDVKACPRLAVAPAAPGDWEGVRTPNIEPDMSAA